MLPLLFVWFIIAAWIANCAPVAKPALVAAADVHGVVLSIQTQSMPHISSTFWMFHHSLCFAVSYVRGLISPIATPPHLQQFSIFKGFPVTIHIRSIVTKANNSIKHKTHFYLSQIVYTVAVVCRLTMFMLSYF